MLDKFSKLGHISITNNTGSSGDGKAMTVQETAPEYRVAEHTIEVADQNLVFRQVVIGDLTPTGAQISHATGFATAQQAKVLNFLPDGEPEDIHPTETVDLTRGDRRFVVVE